MPRFKHLSLAIFSMFFATCAAYAQKEEGYVILDVSGQKVYSAEVEDAWKGLFPDGSAPKFEGFDEDVRQNVLRGLVSERLLFKEAVKAGVPERESVATRLEKLKKQMVIQAYIEELSDGFITEKSLRQAYDQYVAKAEKQEEVRARHILVDTKDKAEGILEKIKAGKNFEKLARTLSADKGSAVSGGDLDYFTKDKMVKEFSDTAFSLKNGEVSEPVKSQFGWHIIKTEDRRPLKVESFENMQEVLKSQVRKQGIERYVDGLIEKVDVKYYSPSGKRKKLSLK